MAARTWSRLGRVFLLTMWLTAPGIVRAAGVENTPVSPEAAITGGAVVASDDPGGGGWYNPASLAAVERSYVSVGASVYSISSYVIKDALTTELPWATLTGDLSGTRYVSVPAVVCYTFRVREGLGLSLGVWTPVHSAYSATVTDASSGPVPGYPALTASYLATYSVFVASDDTWAAAAVGWQVLPTLRLGLSLGGLYGTRDASVDLAASLSTDSTDPSASGGLVQVMVRTNSSIFGLRSVLGLQWEVTPSLRVAATVRSPTVGLNGPGSSSSRTTSAALLLPGQPPLQHQQVELLGPSQSLSEIEPVRLSGGLAWSQGDVRLLLDGDWQPALERRLTGRRSIWELRAAAVWRKDANTTLGLGLFRQADPGIASQGSLAIDEIGLAAGVDYRPWRVVEALGGGKAWDMRVTVAARAAYGSGLGPGLLIVPFDWSSSRIPFFPGQSSTFLEVPARFLGGQLSLFTTVTF